jgi:hypothetical protein
MHACTEVAAMWRRFGNDRKKEIEIRLAASDPRDGIALEDVPRIRRPAGAISVFRVDARKTLHGAFLIDDGIVHLGPPQSFRADGSGDRRTWFPA